MTNRVDENYVSRSTKIDLKNYKRDYIYIYSYIYTKKFRKIKTDINVERYSSMVNFNNKCLRKSFKILEELNYQIYQECSNEMYPVIFN